MASFDSKNDLEKMRISTATLGCKVNQYETEAMEEALIAAGCIMVPLGEPAEAVLINSCAVTHRSDRDVRSLIRRAKRQIPSPFVAAAGCLAQADAEGLLRAGADLVVGNSEKPNLAELLKNLEPGVFVADIGEQRSLQPMVVTSFKGRARAFLKVQDGCNNRCAYCIVPSVRGPSRSLPAAEIREGLARLGSSDHLEVVLTGVHLGAWGLDLNPPQQFASLLDEAEASGIPGIRLSSLEPLELSLEIIKRVADSKSLCPHLHIPLQAGSDQILSSMNRGYTVKEFSARVIPATKAIKDLCLGLDVIVGFPGETNSLFQETFSFLEAFPFQYLHVFPFSPRAGTKAATMKDQINPKEIKDRARKLRELSNKKKNSFYEKSLGMIMPAILEGKPKNGKIRLRTRNYIPVTAPWTGLPPQKEVLVKLVSVEDGIVGGELIES